MASPALSTILIADEVSSAEPILTETPEIELTSSETPESLEEKIQKRAYELWLNRGPNPGSEVDDWLQAEAEILNSPAE